MASIGKPKIRISSKDLKQAVLKKNKSLESKNKALESSIKDQDEQLKSLEKEYSSDSKKYGKLLKDIEFQEERMQKLKGGVYSNEKLLSDKLKKVDKAEKELCGYKSTVENLGVEEKKLLDEIAKLEFYKSKCKESKNELAGIKAKKDNALEELDEVEDEIANTVNEAAKKITYYEDQYDALEEKAKKHEDMVFQFEQRLIDTQDLFKEEENKLKDLLAKSKIEKEQANDELNAIKNLASNTEDKYVKWEKKISKAKDSADKEVERNKNAVEQFKRWKIGVLEEVARLKLKSKVEKIDKAGLSEILNG
jgi:chromosome segregation ATPase